MEKQIKISERKITISAGNMYISLVDPDPETIGAWKGGNISSSIKETCPYCKDIDCEMDCPQFYEHCSDRDSDCFNNKKDERVEFMAHRGAAEALEALILAHAIAGIDVQDSAYIEGVETALNALTNNL